MFDIIDTKSMVDGDAYIVYHDFEFDGDEGLFILHAEKGKHPRTLLKMFRQLTEQRKNCYFCTSIQDGWRNHRESVGYFNNGMEIFRFIV